MGFRSTFTISDCGIDWPQWFVDKYERYVWFSDDHTGTIAANREVKTYYGFETLAEDIQRSAIESCHWIGEREWPIMLVYLHECGGITRCRITRDAIQWTQPDAWLEVDEVEHRRCSGCDTVDAPDRAYGIKT